MGESDKCYNHFEWSVDWKGTIESIYHLCECLIETWLHDNTLQSIVFYCDFSLLSVIVVRQELQQEWQEERMCVRPLHWAVSSNPPKLPQAIMTLHPNAIIAI